ncbi:MAG TPA: hypothetical protein VG735_07945 [Caulobacterales bacterium]|nr:hypothetical protein [Caulobacterales bacterium]
MTAPAPLTPPDCDVSDQEWFPFKHRRLRNSDFWNAASDLARSRSVDLWAVAWEQIPAASLPDNDVFLAAKASFGRDLDAWRTAKSEIMAAWKLCSDGRWYHATLAEIALETWTRKQEKAAERTADAERKRQARQAKAEKNAPVRKTSAKRPPDKRKRPPDVRSITRQDITVHNKEDSSLRSESLPGCDPIKAAFDEFNKAAAQAGWKTATKLNKQRSTAIIARLKADGGLRGWDAQLQRAAGIAWLAGCNGRGWVMDLDYFASERGWLKISEHREGAPHERPLNGAGNGASRPNAADRNRAAADARLAAWDRVIGAGGADAVDGPGGPQEPSSGPVGRAVALAAPEDRSGAETGEPEADQGRGEPAFELLHPE